MTKEIELTITVPYEDYDKDVDVICFMKSYDGGIGRYDFWGSDCIQSVRSWEMYDCMAWDSDTVIDSYIKENKYSIENQAIEKI